MNDLVIRINGQIIENNFDIFHADIIKAIKKADKALVTDTDFIEASAMAATCKMAETAIKDAKQAAISQTIDIEKLFTRMDEVSEAVRQTRLSLEKKIKTEKESRRSRIVEAGIKSVETEIDRVAEKIPQIKSIYKLDKSLFAVATKGKKTVDSIQAAIDEKVKFETEAIDKTILRIVENLEQIEKAECEFPGLFPDKDTICKEYVAMVKSLIESRIANFKLKKLEAENKKKAEEKAAVEKEAETKAAAEKEEAAKETKEPEEQKVTENLPEETLTTQEAPENQPVESTPETEAQTYRLTITIRSTKEEAVEIAKRVAASLVTENRVKNISLSNP